VDVCQTGRGGEWLLFGPAIRQLCRQSDACVALLNPPALPYALGLLQDGIALDQILVIRPRNRQDFVACFLELSRSPACQAVLAWQPGQAVSYSQLRRLQLGTADQRGVYVLFRPLYTRQQSSPAGLRLISRIGVEQLLIQVFKQRGQLMTPAEGAADRTVRLALPGHWFTCLPHRYLGDAGRYASDLGPAEAVSAGSKLAGETNRTGTTDTTGQTKESGKSGNILNFPQAGPGRRRRH